jgi:hypothetical protein
MMPVQLQGGAAGLNRASSGGGAGADRRPTSFPGMSSPSRTSWPWNQNGSGRNTSGHCLRPWAGRGAKAVGLDASETLPTERRGGAVVTMEGGVRSRNGHGGGALFLALILPDFVAPLDKGLRFLELPRVDQVSDVARQFVEKTGTDGAYRHWWRSV